MMATEVSIATKTQTAKIRRQVIDLRYWSEGYTQPAWLYRAERLGYDPLIFTRFTVEPETEADGFSLTVLAGCCDGEPIALLIDQSLVSKSS